MRSPDHERQPRRDRERAHYAADATWRSRQRDRARENEQHYIAAYRRWLAAHGPCTICGSDRRLETCHPVVRTPSRIWRWGARRKRRALRECTVRCASCRVRASCEVRSRRSPVPPDVRQEQVRARKRARYRRGVAEYRAWLVANGPCRTCGSTKRLEASHPMLISPCRIWQWGGERKRKAISRCVVRCAACRIRGSRGRVPYLWAS